MLLLDDIEKRKRLRQKKARDERRRERRIEIEENKKQGKCKFWSIVTGGFTVIFSAELISWAVGWIVRPLVCSVYSEMVLSDEVFLGC